MRLHLGLRSKFFLGMFGIALLMGVAMVTIVKTLVEKRLTVALQQRGVSTAHNIAANAVQPILTAQFLQLNLLFHELRAFDDDIIYIFALDPAGQVLAHTFTDGFPSELLEANRLLRQKGEPVIRRLATDQGEVIDIAAPLLQGTLGEIRLGLSDGKIRKDVDAIIRLLIWLNVGVLLAISMAVAIFDLAITKPILKLVELVQAIGRGEMDRRANLHVSDEIGILGKAFDSMIEKRSQAEQEKEKLIAELQKALAEIQTLQGVIPICAACKKIRDDQGYWQQIESYIREHSEAEFTHGICPDCAKRLYPEFVPKDS